MTSPLTHDEQLEVLINGKKEEALDRFVGGDWSRRYEVFDLPKTVFLKWASTVKLPYGSISDSPATFDGCYVIEDGHQWRCYLQERGRIYYERRFATFEEAKIQALQSTVFYGLELQN